MCFKVQKFERSVEVFRNEIFVLHYFAAKKLKNLMPVFVIPPHAGRHGNIAQRIIDRCVAEGRDVYAIELLSATYQTRNTSISDLINIISFSQKEIIKAEKVDLIGLCQGAWLAALYTSLNQDMVNRYCNFAGPINTKTGQDNVIENYCKNLNMEWHRLLINLNNGIQPGSYQWLMFSLVDPTYVYYTRWVDYAKAFISGNEKEIKKQVRNNSWYNYSQDLAGNWFLNCLEYHFGKNAFYEGTWNIDGKVPNLANITCDIYLYAGDIDQITHPQQVFDMAKKVSSKNIKMTTFKDAGHTKVFVGSEEMDEFARQFL